MSNMINIINDVDTEDLGEIMMDFAESLQLRGVNIVVCNITEIGMLHYYTLLRFQNLKF